MRVLAQLLHHFVWYEGFCEPALSNTTWEGSLSEVFFHTTSETISEDKTEKEENVRLGESNHKDTAEKCVSFKRRLKFS